MGNSVFYSEETCVGNGHAPWHIICQYSNDTLRSVRVLWGVHPDVAASTFLHIGAFFAERLGGLESVASVGRSSDYLQLKHHRLPMDFSELLLHAKQGSVAFDAGKAQHWTPENGLLGIDAAQDLTQLVHELALVTSVCDPQMVERYAQYAARVRPYAPPPCGDRTQSPAAQRR